MKKYLKTLKRLGNDHVSGKDRLKTTAGRKVCNTRTQQPETIPNAW